MNMFTRNSTTELAGLGLRPVTDLSTGIDTLRRRRAGRIVTESARLRCVSGRWWPHVGNLLQVHLDETSRRGAPDRCELFYHVPLTSPSFLTLSYVRSSNQTSLSTFYAATLVLDEIARIKGSSAIVCNVTNGRLSDRLMARWGWESHCEHMAGRHFIKRFYGDYPSIASPWLSRLAMA